MILLNFTARFAKGAKNAATLRGLSAANEKVEILCDLSVFAVKNKVAYNESELFWKEETMSIELKQTLNDLYLKLEQLKGYL